MRRPPCIGGGWLYEGIPAAQVAEWAGHSIAERRIEETIGDPGEDDSTASSSMEKREMT
jgi:hypothetical protein